MCCGHDHLAGRNVLEHEIGEIRVGRGLREAVSQENVRVEHVSAEPRRLQHPAQLRALEVDRPDGAVRAGQRVCEVDPLSMRADLASDADARKRLPFCNPGLPTLFNR